MTISYFTSQFLLWRSWLVVFITAIVIKIRKYNFVLAWFLINISLYALVSSTNLFRNETLYCVEDTVQFRAENYFLVLIMVLSAITIFHTVIRMLDKAEKTIKELEHKVDEQQKR